MKNNNFAILFICLFGLNPKGAFRSHRTLSFYLQTWKLKIHFLFKLYTLIRLSPNPMPPESGSLKNTKYLKTCNSMKGGNIVVEDGKFYDLSNKTENWEMLVLEFVDLNDIFGLSAPPLGSPNFSFPFLCLPLFSCFLSVGTTSPPFKCYSFFCL